MQKGEGVRHSAAELLQDIRDLKVDGKQRNQAIDLEQIYRGTKPILTNRYRYDTAASGQDPHHNSDAIESWLYYSNQKYAWRSTKNVKNRDQLKHKV